MTNPTAAAKDAGTTTTGATSYLTGSKTWTAGRLYALFVGSTATTPLDPTAVTMNVGGQAWTKVAAGKVGGNYIGTCYVWIGVAITDQVKIDFGAVSQSGQDWVIYDITGADTSVSALAAVVQSASATGTSAAPSAALGSAPASSSLTIGFCFIAANAAITAGAAFQTATQTGGHASPNARAAGELDNGTPQQTADWSITSVAWVCWALEIAAPGSVSASDSGAGSEAVGDRALSTDQSGNIVVEGYGDRGLAADQVGEGSETVGDRALAADQSGNVVVETVGDRTFAVTQPGVGTDATVPSSASVFAEDGVAGLDQTMPFGIIDQATPVVEALGVQLTGRPAFFRPTVIQLMYSQSPDANVAGYVAAGWSLIQTIRNSGGTMRALTIAAPAPTWASGKLTFHVSNSPHGVLAGQMIYVRGITTVGIDGAYLVDSVSEAAHTITVPFASNPGTVVVGSGDIRPLSVFPDDTAHGGQGFPAYQAQIEAMIASFGPALKWIVIENESTLTDQTLYHADTDLTSFGDMIASAKAATIAAGRPDIKVTDSGIISPTVRKATYKDLLDQGRTADAAQFATDTGLSPSDPSIGSQSIICKRWMDQTVRGGADAECIHVYNTATTFALDAQLAFVAAYTGLPAITNEMGSSPGDAPTVAAIRAAVDAAGIGVAILYGTPSLFNPGLGVLTTVGQTWADEIAAAYPIGAGSAVVEASALGGAFALAESGSGADAIKTFSFAVADSGVGVDAAALLVLFGLADSGAGLEQAASIVASILATQAALGSETSVLTTESGDVFLSTEEAVVALDLSALVAILPPVADTGAGTDATALEQFLAALDQGYADELAAIAIAVSAGDVGTAVDRVRHVIKRLELAQVGPFEVKWHARDLVEVS